MKLIYNRYESIHKKFFFAQNGNNDFRFQDIGGIRRSIFFAYQRSGSKKFCFFHVCNMCILLGFFLNQKLFQNNQKLTKNWYIVHKFIFRYLYMSEIWIGFFKLNLGNSFLVQAKSFNIFFTFFVKNLYHE